MDSQERTLPDYSLPPVNEVVLGVQFDTLERFTAVHPGLFWQRIRETYPVFSAQPPLATVTESFEGPTQPQIGMQATLSQIPPLPRCWFLDKSENHLVQVQSERFVHNWKKVTGTENYPHYDNIIPDFKRQWQNFLCFVNDEDVGEIKLNHWEVTYVNHISQGEGWSDFGDVYKVFPMLSTNVLGKCLQTPEKISLSLAYSFPDKLTRLHVDLATAYRRSDNALLLRLTLTARGRLESNDDQALYESLDFGHETIVKSFTDLTSPEAHKIWKRRI